ncbi:hypothetical protein [Marinospirillum alkaliphilum]|uniref:Oxaloacetate decarboxylase, gamma chain n=1 Tax=Marinospirillum alkaliphilum DSM 21637 TaxID=1122209 RepID=A0A1K1V293_9GAMM|nr:hypothetical protein [Marinospirillum alkaliphilum]SFX19257.1 hypothetical protein SAMN02745752_00742 [Marinospirillum alkaliphilum DSM 21637]
MMMHSMQEGGAMMGWMMPLVGFGLLLLVVLSIAALIKYLFGKK